MAGARPKGQRLDHFAAGDSIRGLTAYCVVATHAAYAGVVAAGLPPGGLAEMEHVYREVPGRILDAFQITIYNFFVLSAFLIARPFVRAYIDGTRRPKVGAYLENRARRILPVWWLAVTGVLLTGGAAGADLLDMVQIYFFNQNSAFEVVATRGYLAPGWTLGVEVVFYLAVPVVAGLAYLALPDRLGIRGRLAVVLVAAAVVLAGSMWLRGRGVANIQHFRNPFNNIFFLMPGIVLAALEPYAKARLGPGAAVRIGAAALIVLALGAGVAWSETRAGDAALRGFLAMVFATCFVSAPMVMQWARLHPWRWLVNRVFAWTGERSYSIYLIHVIVVFELQKVLDFVHGPRDRAVITLLLTLLIVWPLADLSYRYIERPFLRKRKDWKRDEGREEHSPAPGPEPSLSRARP